MHKALIGITCGMEKESHNITLRAYYGVALEALGAAYIMLPPQDLTVADQVLEFLDGLILPGGGDIHPKFWDEEPQKSIKKVDAVRDKWELALAEKAIKKQIPLLGICRGMQVINVALGGSIWQDNPVITEHEQTSPYTQPWHLVKLNDADFISLTGKESGYVNSCHHQAVRRIGQGLKVAAKATDGTVEAIIGSKYVLGVQWHPEYMWQQDGISRELFRSFIDLCSVKKQDYQ